MSMGKTFYSKRFFLVNLVLVGVIAGFALSFVIFGCSSDMKAGESVAAQENGQRERDDASVQSLKSMQNSFRSVAEEVLPEVVTLQVVDVVERDMPQQGWPWDFLQPDRRDNQNGDGREFRRRGLGSGVIVRNEGETYYVLTNSHVVGDADEINVVLHNQEEYTAERVGSDPRRDLALVKFTSGEEISVAELGDSEELRVGDWVLAMGSPFGFVNSVTAGIVSAKGRTGPQNTISQFIQTDAAINRGNSGGALVNIEGEVIGINTWIAAPSGGSIGLGFAVPINTAKRSVEDMIEKGEVDYGWLGVSLSGMSDELADSMELDTQNGAFIQNVYLDSPAWKGGIKPGDFITGVDGQDIQSSDELVRVVGNLQAGDSVEFELIRYGEQRTVTVSIGERRSEEEIGRMRSKLWPGMIAVPLSDRVRSRLELDSSVSGVIVANLQENTRAFIGGLRPNDVITEINGEEIDAMLDFYRAINESGRSRYSIEFIREGSSYTVEINRP